MSALTLLRGRGIIRRRSTASLGGPAATLTDGYGGCSSVARAPGCGPGGRGFNSPHSPFPDPDPHWWATTSIYQIYPRSFFDANGDGIGDFRGIIAKLPYIRDLGFEAIWLSPFFASPQADFGYDVSDYTNVAPEYGSLADVSALIDAAHGLGLRVIFDLVLNHTSDQHPWFLESRRSRQSTKRDWYLWRPGKGKRPPNHWPSLTGGRAWQFDAQTSEWYLATFLPFQPDLNLRNPEVRAALLEVVRFWLERGVDGFRLDLFHALFKDAEFRDNPISTRYVPHNDEAGFFQLWKYNLNQPETAAFAAELRRFVESRSPGALLLGEVAGPPETVRAYLGDDHEGLNLVFHWDLLDARADADSLRRVIASAERRFPSPYTPVYVLGNHDRRRVQSRLGGDTRLMKLLAMLQFTVRGVPVTYYGEEIGMTEADLPAAAALDPLAARYRRIPLALLEALKVYVNRDGCRTPMQWSSERKAGFSPNDESWLPVNPNFPEVNVAAQIRDPDSLLHAYRALLTLRREIPVLRSGELTHLESHGGVLSYRRRSGGGEVLVVMNFSGSSASYVNESRCRRVLFAVGMTASNTQETLRLEPYAGVVLGQ